MRLTRLVAGGGGGGGVAGDEAERAVGFEDSVGDVGEVGDAMLACCLVDVFDGHPLAVDDVEVGTAVFDHVHRRAAEHPRCRLGAA